MLANPQNVSPLVFFPFFYVSFMEKKRPIKFYGVFYYFPRTYEVAKFWMIKLCLNVIDVVHANGHTKHGIGGLHINFWNFFFMPFVLWSKMIILSKSCYFGLRLPLRQSLTHLHCLKRPCSTGFFPKRHVKLRPASCW